MLVAAVLVIPVIAVEESSLDEPWGHARGGDQLQSQLAQIEQALARRERGD